MKTASGMSSTLGALGGQLQQPNNAFGLLGGLLGNKPFGIIGADGARTGILADMFDGGGRGASGDTFQGGILSGLLNAIGIRPIGFSNTQQPQMSEQDVRAQMGNAPSVMAPPPASTPAAPPNPAPMYSPRGRAAPMSASPEYFSPGLTPPGAMTTAPMQPTQFGGQSAAPRPYVDVGMPDIGTVRPGVSRAGGRIPPMMGFTPNVEAISTPRPAGMGLGPDAGRAATMEAFREMQRRAFQLQGLLPR